MTHGSVTGGRPHRESEFTFPIFPMGIPLEYAIERRCKTGTGCVLKTLHTRKLHSCLYVFCSCGMVITTGAWENVNQQLTHYMALYAFKGRRVSYAVFSLRWCILVPHLKTTELVGEPLFASTHRFQTENSKRFLERGHV